MTSAKRGAYYKNKTRRWLERRGWQVADMEVIRWVGTGAKRFPVKRDQFGSDLLAIAPEPNDAILFIQVKGGKSARGNFRATRRAFAAFSWPDSTRRQVYAWLPRAREPRIVDMSEEAPAESE